MKIEEDSDGRIDDVHDNDVMKMMKKIVMEE
jgi:hypothetical protein